MIVSQYTANQRVFECGAEKDYRVTIYSETEMSRMRRVIVISSIEPTAVKTGRIEEVVGAVLAAHELDLNNTVIIEHCPENPLFEETFDILKFEPEQGGQKLCNPQWKQQSRANVESLIGTEFDAQSHPTR